MGATEIVEALIKQRRGLTEIEAKLDALDLNGRDIDRRLDRVERLILNRANAADRPVILAEVLRAARAVIDARDDHFDWDDLKESIATLGTAIDRYDGIK